MGEGTYYIDIRVWGSDEVQIPDENPENNIWIESFDLINYDDDGDGVVDSIDECPGTPLGDEVDDFGCSDTQKDDDNDGASNAVDYCPNTPAGEEVDEYGCSDTQKDDDSDGVTDDIDECPDTPDDGEEVDEYGCSDTQKDDDNDGVSNAIDYCAQTNNQTSVDENGCSNYQLDDDNDGISNAVDICPDTPLGEYDTVEDNGTQPQGCQHHREIRILIMYLMILINAPILLDMIL